MKIIMADILNAIKPLEVLIDQPLSFQTAYKVNKIKKVVQEEAEYYTTELRKLVEEYGDRDEEGNLKYDEKGDILLQPEKAFECNTKAMELLQIEVELNEPQITIAELESVTLSPNMVELLMCFIKEDN